MTDIKFLAAEALLAFLQLVSTVAAIGFVYGRIKTQLEQFHSWQEHVSELLGNGKPGLFLRRDEAVLIMKNADNEREEIFRRLNALEGK